MKPCYQKVWTYLSRADALKIFRKSHNNQSCPRGSHPTMKPRMHVKVGDTVKRGQLFSKIETRAFILPPGAGEIVAIHRGDKRAFQSLVIALNESRHGLDQFPLKLSVQKWRI